MTDVVPTRLGADKAVVAVLVPDTSRPVADVTAFVAPLYCNATPDELFTRGVVTDVVPARLGADTDVVAVAAPLTAMPVVCVANFVEPLYCNATPLALFTRGVLTDVVASSVSHDIAVPAVIELVVRDVVVSDVVCTRSVTTLRPDTVDASTCCPLPMTPSWGNTNVIFCCDRIFYFAPTKFERGTTSSMPVVINNKRTGKEEARGVLSKTILCGNCQHAIVDGQLFVALDEPYNCLIHDECKGLMRWDGKFRGKPLTEARIRDKTAFEWHVKVIADLCEKPWFQNQPGLTEERKAALQRLVTLSQALTQAGVIAEQEPPPEFAEGYEKYVAEEQAKAAQVERREKQRQDRAKRSEALNRGETPQ